MPIYEYECPECSKKFELLWKGQTIGITGHPYHKELPQISKCPNCGSLYPRVMSIYNFQFSQFLPWPAELDSGFDDG